MSTPAAFVANYSTAECQARIAFAWNRKHAEQFLDANQEFRHPVVEHVLADLHTVTIELVRDLFDAETAFAKEAWGVNGCVTPLARELLTRGGPEYVEDYLRGKLGRGMDAHCAAYFLCPRLLAEQLLAEVERRLAAGAEGNRKALLESGREIFREWVEDARD